MQPKQKSKRGQAWVLVNKQQGYVSIDCADGIYYRGWTWGREFETGKTLSVAPVIETKSVECTGKGIGSNDELGEDVVEWLRRRFFNSYDGDGVSMRQILVMCVARVAIVVMVGGSVVACGSTAPDSQVARHERVILAPVIAGGVGGWCISLADGRCSIADAGYGAIVAVGVGPQRQPSSQRVIVVVKSEVRSISVDNGAPVQTYSEAALPRQLRVAVVEVRNGPQRCLSRLKVCIAAPPRVVGLGIDKNRVEEWSEHQAQQLLFTVPTHAWNKHPYGEGVCSIRLAGTKAKAVEGAVAKKIMPRQAFIPGETIACASTIYKSGGQNLFAGVLLDAEHPGVNPTLPPAAKLWRSGVYQARWVATGEFVTGPVLLRRIAGGLLVVAEGRSNAQRLAVLKHLHVDVLSSMSG